MLRPDNLSREYARILPELKTLGYRADMKPSFDCELFVLTVSRQPTTRVFNDGTWERDDGKQGDNPPELLDLFTSERLKEMQRAVERHDARSIAQTLLIMQVAPECVVMTSKWDGDSLDVEYRRRTSINETVRFPHAEQQAAAVINRLMKGDDQ